MIGSGFPLEGVDLTVLSLAFDLDEPGSHANLTQKLSGRSGRDFRFVVQDNQLVAATLMDQPIEHPHHV